MGRKITIDYIRKYVELQGYLLLSLSYTTKKKLLMVCGNNHLIRMTWDNFKYADKRCIKCYNKKRSKKQRLLYNDVKSYIESVNYKLISNNYINCGTKLEFECSEGHKFNMRWSNFKNGQRCPECKKINLSKIKTLTYEYVKEQIEKNGYKLISEEYKASHKHLLVECNKGHQYKVTYGNFMQGYRCPICSPTYSKGEREIAELIINLIPNNKILVNDRTMINPLELDVYIPELNLAIEYCGLYWHNDEHITRNYHRTKMDMCREREIRLITIFEDEWINQKDIVVSRLIQTLNMQTNRVYARKCKIKELTSKLANEFYRINHLQGATCGKLHAGLYYNDELVQAMTIGSPSRAHTHTGLELKRLATKCNYSVVGGTSKLFKYVLSKTELSIRSHNDLRWGKYLNNIYELLGFTKIGESNYTPHYTKGQSRFRNQGLCKTLDERTTGKTEWELRKEQGYSRIWDCGHQTWEYIRK